MGRQLVFWKYEEGVYLDNQVVYKKICNQEEINGLSELSIDEILKKTNLVFSGYNKLDNYNFESEKGSFTIYTTKQSLIFDCSFELPETELNKIIDIMLEFECPFYDPQIEIRFDGKSKKETDLQNLIIKAAKEKQYAKVVEAYEANPDVEIKHLLENNIIAAYNNLDKYDEALEALDKFKARFENRMRIWYYFAGYAYVGKEDCEKAEECIKAGIDECNREKEANILIGTRYKNEVADFIYFQWQCQRIKALRFLKDRISSDSKLPEIVQAFKEMCRSKFEFEEGPLLLFEAYAGAGESYSIHLVRQAEYLRYEEYYQLTIDIEYSQEEVRQKAISEVFCNYNQDGDIFEYIGSSQAYILLKDLKPSKINIEEVDIEDCVSEKDIKLKTDGSLKENPTVSRKLVSNEEDILKIDERIQRIVRKMEGFSDKHFIYECGVFPPVWDKPYSVEKVESFEKEMNIKLPLEYKRFITTFAGGGTQPFYGFMPLFKGENQNLLSDPDARKKFLYTIRKPLNIYKLSKEEYAQIYFDRTINVDQGYVMLTHEGDAMYSILIVNTDDPDTYGTVWFYDLADDAGIYPLKNPANDKPMGFLDWFEYYVDKTLEMGEEDYFSYGDLAWQF